MFERLIHCDWGVDQKKRWCAEARKDAGRWYVESVRQVGPSSAFVDQAFSEGTTALLGFDFPIGLPAAYGMQTGLAGFKEALAAFGEGRWSEVFDVAEDPACIALTRPFFPRRSLKGSARASLVSGLGVNSFDELLRRCERKTDKRNAACSVFWTLGGNQVGKGAISGWQEVIKPSVARGAGLWAFRCSTADAGG